MDYNMCLLVIILPLSQQLHYATLQLIRVHQLAFGCAQHGPVAFRTETLVNIFRFRFQINQDTGFLDEIERCLVGNCSAAERNDRARRQRYFAKEGSLHFAEFFFPILLEDVADFSTAAFFDEKVEVNKRISNGVGENRPDGTFPASHESGQKNYRVFAAVVHESTIISRNWSGVSMNFLHT